MFKYSINFVVLHSIKDLACRGLSYLILPEPNCNSVIVTFLAILPHRFKAYSGINKTALVLGQHRQLAPDSFTVRVPVGKVIINEKFNGTREFTSDIMLVKLAHPVEFNDAVSPICLPSTLFQEFPAGKRCFSTGWGTLSSK